MTMLGVMAKDSLVLALRNLPKDPFVLFNQWFVYAKANLPSFQLAGAMCLSTVSDSSTSSIWYATGQSQPSVQSLNNSSIGSGSSSHGGDSAAFVSSVPCSYSCSSRIVMLRQHDDRGFGFFTNKNSRKASDIRAFPEASLVFHWAMPKCTRTVRIEGWVEEMSEEENDEAWRKLPRANQIQAYVTEKQSTAVEMLDDADADYAADTDTADAVSVVSDVDSSDGGADSSRRALDALQKHVEAEYTGTAITTAATTTSVSVSSCATAVATVDTSPNQPCHHADTNTTTTNTNNDTKEQSQIRLLPIPRPPFWGGYRVVPRHMEFWQGRRNDTAHDRFLYSRRYSDCSGSSSASDGQQQQQPQLQQQRRGNTYSNNISNSNSIEGVGNSDGVYEGGEHQEWTINRLVP